MPYPPDHKRQSHNRILSAAARQFRAKGFDQASVGSIMREAGLTHGGFYAHFQSKDDLVSQVIRGGFDQATERFEARFQDLEGEAWLRAWVYGYLSDQHLESIACGCPMPSLAGEIGRSDTTTKDAFTDLFTQRIERWLTHVDAPENEARSRMLAAFSQMAGALMLARTLNNEMATAIRSSAAEHAMEILLGGSATGAHQK
ncbi:MAG: TetR/AcrR family transcriptional regulator [Planctomycetota bacterium]